MRILNLSIKGMHSHRNVSRHNHLPIPIPARREYIGETGVYRRDVSIPARLSIPARRE